MNRPPLSRSPRQNRSVKIILLRHAETLGNLLKQYIGATDEPLSSEGITRAQATLSDKTVERVYTSDMARTKHTARLLYPDAEIVPIAGLSEMNFGVFEGRTADEMEGDEAYRDWVDALCMTSCPGGENIASFTQRCVQSFLQVLADAEEIGAKELVFVVHGGTIMAILSQLAMPAKPHFDWRAGFCRGYLLEYNKDKLSQEGERILNVLDVI
jgi:alpha-ribazole phosphatase